jgi:hypothetical protein
MDSSNVSDFIPHNMLVIMSSITVLVSAYAALLAMESEEE